LSIIYYCFNLEPAARTQTGANITKPSPIQPETNNSQADHLLTSYNQNFTTNYPLRIYIKLNGNDSNSDPITFSIISQRSNGRLQDFNSTSGELTYNPPGYTGTDSFSFQVMDIHNATSNIARVSITINPAPEESTIPLPSEQQPSLTEQTPSQGPMTFWFHLTNKHFLDNVAIKATGEIGGTVEYRTRLFLGSD